MNADNISESTFAEAPVLTPRLELASDAKTLALQLPASSQTARAADIDCCIWQLSRIRAAMGKLATKHLRCLSGAPAAIRELAN